jgi:beta-galactosidase
MTLRVLRYGLGVVVLLGLVWSGRGERTVVSLDGTWGFQLDPQDIGRKGQWFAAPTTFTNTIRVPGAWQAQGYGEDGPKLRHNYEGKAWYQRQVRLPKTEPGQRFFLCFGGVHRSAEVWFNGAFLGEHIGYLSAFEFELPPLLTESTATVAVCVDCKQHWERDCLMGCTDLVDEMFTPWGGLSGHVWVEARPASWLEDVFVQPKLAPLGCVVTARVAGSKETVNGARLQIGQGEGMFRRVANYGKEISGAEWKGSFSAASGQVCMQLELPEAKLWSPEEPHLYVARLELLKDGAVVDQRDVRFGLREIRIEGPHFYLNGKKLFLRGYGDDAIYPETMAPPTDKQVYRKKLEAARAYGFNFVRHHSHFLPAEYYAAADEVGMLISPELPIAYQEYYAKAKGPALELYQTEWAAAIKQLRNHPSIFDWCMGNEMYAGVPISPALYRAAKALDPTRPVLDSDGLVGSFLPQGATRGTLDFFACQFDENTLPLDNPGKHQFGPVPKKPAIGHETGNYVTVPRLDLVEQFKDNFKPFWLTPFRAKLERLGLVAEAQQWSLNSEALYCLAHKLNLEDLRKNPRLSGYEWWLLQDYWTGANGLYDTYFRPKSIRPETVRQFNGPTVLLLEGLPTTCSASNALKLKLLVSNYAAEPIRKGRLRWTAKLGTRVLGEPHELPLDAAQGELVEAGRISLELPAVSRPEKLVLEAELSGSGAAAQNEWYAWVYPEPKLLTTAVTTPLFASHELMSQIKPFGARLVPSGEALPTNAVYVVTQPDRRLLQAAEAGASLLCLSPAGLFPTAVNRFKPAWWLGNPNDCNAGTVVYPNPVTREMAPEGWCDLGWYRLLEGAQAFLLDEVPFVPSGSGSSLPRPVLVRALDVHTVCRNKALLWEAKVGRGSMVVSGLRLEPVPDAPERAWVLKRLIEYAASLPQPTAALPLSFLQQKVGESALPRGPFVSGFARLLSSDAEKGEYPSCRENQAPTYICRQLETGRLLEWETDLVPAGWSEREVTFAFAGGLGWISQPKGAGFTLLLNGKALLHFEVTATAATWSGNGAQLTFVPRKNLPEDALGLFYLTVPVAQVKPGAPGRLSVRSEAQGSRRWFGLNPYSDLGTK